MKILYFAKKVLFAGGLSLSLLIFFTDFACGQSNQTAANKSWNIYWTKFTNAVKTKNHKSIIALTSKRFFSPSGETINDLLNQPYFWKLLQTSVKKGTKPHQCKKSICRITRNKSVESSLVFVFENNRWGFIGQLGE